MNELNISSFIQIMQTGFIQHDKQEAAGVFLLDAVNLQSSELDNGYYVSSLSAKKISRIVNQIDPVPDGIKQASMQQPVIDGVVKYFKEIVAPDLNPHLIEETIGKIVQLISIDVSIPESKKKKLMALYGSRDEGIFLAHVFLYALNRPNKKHHATIEYQDVPLLAEANYECPLCHKKLVDTIKGTPVRKYRITHIFPVDLDSERIAEFSAIYPIPQMLEAQDNLIALDEECSDAYLFNPTMNEYKNLREIKNKLTKNYAAKNAVSEIKLEEDIRTILDALSFIHDLSNLEVLEYDAVRIDEKFKPENCILKNETQYQVLTYYRYIERVFSESNIDFDMIASEIKVTSRKLEKIGLPQAEVINQLSEWIRNNARLGTESSLACNIVVSFFIQNCEVFHK